MDPDTSKKVSDLLSLMEGISSDIDIKAELEDLYIKIKNIEDSVENLNERFDGFEKKYLEKQQQVRAIENDLRGLYPTDK